MSKTNETIKEDKIEELYRQLNIEIISSVNIEILAKEYKESIVAMERECVNTTAYITR